MIEEKFTEKELELKTVMDKWYAGKRVIDSISNGPGSFNGCAAMVDELARKYGANPEKMVNYLRTIMDVVKG